MGVKERIIAFKLLEQKENHLAFLEEIGVAVELKKIEGDIVEVKKNKCIKEEKDYGKKDSKWNIRKA